MKILITSDIHIHDFRSHNILGDPLFRLHQFDKLSNRLVQIIKDEKADAVFIAGDFLHTANPRPYIVNTAGRFLKTISKVVPVYITHGQHDFDSRTLMSTDNTLLSLYNNINDVHYLHEQSVDIGGIKVYFQGWTPEQDFSKVRFGEYDILIGHATINSATMNEYGTEATGPEYDNDKFKMAFMGDIHYGQVKDNQVIPGVPIQNNFGDGSNNSVIILDTTDLTWKRVKTETTEFRFLKFLTTNTVYDDPYILTKPPGVSKALAQKENLTKSVDILEVIDKYVKSEKLTTIHDKAMVITSKIESEELNLRYEIESLEITNFKSIEHFKWEPTTGISVIHGLNGTGKSSLVEAMRFALIGSRDAKEFLRDDATEMSVDISIVYAGVSYRIIRGYKKSGYVKYFINDKEIEAENQKAANSRIFKDLSFIDMYYILHRDQRTPLFLGSNSYADRVDMLSKVIGLSIVERLKVSAEKLREEIEVPIKGLNSEILNITMYLDSMKDLKFDDINVSYTEEIEKLNEIISQLTILADLDAKNDSYETELNRIKYGLAQFSHYDFTALGNSDNESTQNKLIKIQAELNRVKSESIEIDKTLRNVRDSISTKQSNIIQVNKSLTDLNAKKSKIVKNTCYTCHQIINEDLTNKLIDDIQSDIDEKVMESKKLAAEVPALLIKVKELSEKSSELSEQAASLVTEKNTLSNIADKAKQLNEAHDRYTAIKTQESSVNSNLEETAKKIKNFRFLLSRKFNLTLSTSSDTSSKITESKELIASYKEKIATQERLKSIQSDISNKKSKLTNLEKELAEIMKDKALYDKYISLMAPNGSVIRSVLTTISDNISTDKIKVVAYKTLQSGETRPDFNLYLNVADKWRNYDLLSGGQQIACDIFILKNLIDLAGGAGSLVFDETFGQLDPESLEFAIDILRGMKVNHTFIISHAENFPYYDTTIVTNFSDKGITTYKIGV